MNKRIAVKRITDLDVTIDGAFYLYCAIGQVADVNFNRVGITIGIGAEPDRGGAGSPAGFFLVLKSVSTKTVYYTVGNCDPAFPVGPAITIANACTAPANTDVSVAIAGFFLKITFPETAGVVKGGNLVPTQVAQETIVDLSITAMFELIALNKIIAVSQADQAFAGCCKCVACP